MKLDKITWTDELVIEWLEIAAKVDRALPEVKVAGYMSYSMVIVRTELEILQACNEGKNRFRPTPDQIEI